MIKVMPMLLCFESGPSLSRQSTCALARSGQPLQKVIGKHMFTVGPKAPFYLFSANICARNLLAKCLWKVIAPCMYIGMNLGGISLAALWCWTTYRHQETFRTFSSSGIFNYKSCYSANKDPGRQGPEELNVQVVEQRT